MEFIVIALCAFAISQTNSAPIKQNVFELPELARDGFTLSLNATIHKDMLQKLQDVRLKVIITEKACQESTAAQKEEVDMYICIVPDDDTLNKRDSNSHNPIFFQLEIQGNKLSDDDLELQFYLDSDHQTQEITRFDKFRRVSVGGVIESIKILKYEFGSS